MSTHRESKKIHSYRQERLKSAHKGLSESISFSKDIEQLESAMKISINRRSTGTLSSMRLSLQRQLSQSFCVKSPQHMVESSLRLSNVNDRFISKYMDKNKNIMEVSEDEPVSHVLAEKRLNNNIILKPKKKMIESVVRKDGGMEKGTPRGSKNLGKLIESRVVQQKTFRKKVNKVEIAKVIKKVEVLGEEIERLELACGKEISREFQMIINRMREEGSS